MAGELEYLRHVVLDQNPMKFIAAWGRLVDAPLPDDVTSPTQELSPSVAWLERFVKLQVPECHGAPVATATIADYARALESRLYTDCYESVQEPVASVLGHLPDPVCSFQRWDTGLRSSFLPSTEGSTECPVMSLDVMGFLEGHSYRPQDDFNDTQRRGFRVEVPISDLLIAELLKYLHDWPLTDDDALKCLNLSGPYVILMQCIAYLYGFVLPQHDLDTVEDLEDDTFFEWCERWFMPTRLDKSEELLRHMSKFFAQSDYMQTVSVVGG